MKIKNIKEKAVLLGLYGLSVALLYFSGIGCIFKRLFNVVCAGCGMTRALLSLMSFDIKSAVYYNPMVFSLPVLFLYFIFDGNLFKNKTLNRVVISVILAGFLVNWVINLLTGKPI